MGAGFERFLLRQWQKRGIWAYACWPLSRWVSRVAQKRRHKAALAAVPLLSVPVIVVGNLTVGGAGKSPCVITIAQWLETQGYNPGLLTRGYRGNADSWPQDVCANSDAAAVGDESVVLAQRTGFPVVAGPDRAVGAKRLIAQGCTVIVSDDGFQHFALPRHINCLVVDGEQRFGNGWCMPSGPLREPLSALSAADITLSTQAQDGEFEIQRSLADACDFAGVTTALSHFKGQTVTAVAGIGKPERFFKALDELGIICDVRAYRDHHVYTEQDVASWPEPILLTEKDAVKCRPWLAGKQAYSVPLNTVLEPDFYSALAHLLEEKTA